ncbi:hypothetical protein [Dysgonomonas sp. Marseille-P4677]|nr:hypothetical protein [Dysgonomonas sp. Marseille-P4677]
MFLFNFSKPFAGYNVKMNINFPKTTTENRNILPTGCQPVPQ